MNILTDIELRAHWFKEHQTRCEVDADTMITPAARDFLREHHIELIVNDKKMDELQNDVLNNAHATDHLNVNKKTESGFEPMPVSPIPENSNHKLKYIIAATGEEVDVKPENMTHLRGNLLVSKSHPQIAFRGKLDSLEAKIIEIQTMAFSEGREDLSKLLQELLGFVRHILGCEVMDTLLGDIRLLGLDSNEIRHMSHDVRGYFGIPHPMPDYKMGRICTALNSLRTLVRETELQAVGAFSNDGKCSHKDIIEALNRLSSCVYILFCAELTGKRPYLKDDNGAVRMPDSASSQEETKKTDGLSSSDTPYRGCRTEGIMVEASGRHVHLTKDVIKILFGKEELTHKSDLSQPGQFAAKERVKLMTSKGEIDNVAVLGPARNEVQVEMSLTDARILGIDIPVNLSGNLNGAADVIIVGPCGIYNAVGAAIASKAHIHMTPKDALRFKVSDGDSVAVRLVTKRPVTIDDVVIRVHKNFSLAMHLDYDEANACQYKKGDLGYIIT
ncbi:MAG: phosphate propanoyltransferase [Clostridiales bacterium]|nr:phosphate propanoyltransferase [Clostridiales bacterium]MDY3747322.1 phosphate propanoyltransferase [Lachnospiraceae bacterium]